MAGRIDHAGPGPVAPIAHVAPTRPVAALGDAGQESLRRLAQLEIGRAFSAEVLSRLPGGEFVVGIAGTAARMALPEGTAVGERLSLTLVGREPRPLFLLDRAAQDPAAVLSPAARLIDSLLRQERGDAVAGAAPLLPMAPAQPVDAGAGAATLADALASALEYSGLFHESHVAAWARGERSMDQLLREPQMRAASVLPPALSSDADALQTLAASSFAALPASGQAPLPDIDAGRLIGMQLDTLEQRRVAWQGELFPGQPLRWEVAEAPDDRHAGKPAQAAAERAWHSAVRIELPALGTVAATLQLQQGRLQIQVRAADLDAAGRLSAHGAELAEALQAAGMTLERWNVRHEPA